MKKGASKPLTPHQLAELKSLAALPNDAIDTSDAPEVLDWSGARRQAAIDPSPGRRCDRLVQGPHHIR